MKKIENRFMYKNLFILLFVMSSANIFSQNTVMVIGHRGCRGYYPENSIQGFQEALNQGADGIEWDVVVNGDGNLVVSHEPYFHADFCTDAEGNEISDESAYNMYKMTQKEIESFDCGSKIHPNFPEQNKVRAYKPLLSDVVGEIPRLKHERILFEIKSEPEEYGLSQPFPKEFAELVLKETEELGLKNVLYMSFDAQILEELHQKDPKNLNLVYLIEKRGIKKQLSSLSFKPAYVGVYYKYLNARSVKYIRKNKLGIFAWTVNEVRDAHRMMDLGIDGIITDYPKRIIQARGTYSDR